MWAGSTRSASVTSRPRIRRVQESPNRSRPVRPRRVRRSPGRGVAVVAAGRSCAVLVKCRDVRMFRGRRSSAKWDHRSRGGPFDQSRCPARIRPHALDHRDCPRKLLNEGVTRRVDREDQPTAFSEGKRRRRRTGEDSPGKCDWRGNVAKPADRPASEARRSRCGTCRIPGGR